MIKMCAPLREQLNDLIEAAPIPSADFGKYP